MSKIRFHPTNVENMKRFYGAEQNYKTETESTNKISRTVWKKTTKTISNRHNGSTQPLFRNTTDKVYFTRMILSIALYIINMNIIWN